VELVAEPLDLGASLVPNGREPLVVDLYDSAQPLDLGAGGLPLISGTVELASEPVDLEAELLDLELGGDDPVGGSSDLGVTRPKEFDQLEDVRLASSPASAGAGGTSSAGRVPVLADAVAARARGELTRLTRPSVEFEVERFGGPHRASSPSVGIANKGRERSLSTATA